CADRALERRVAEPAVVRPCGAGGAEEIERRTVCETVRDQLDRLAQLRVIVDVLAGHEPSAGVVAEPPQDADGIGDDDGLVDGAVASPPNRDLLALRSRGRDQVSGPG